MKKLLLFGLLLLFFTGCNQERINVTKQPLPNLGDSVYSTKIVVFALNNYTDIPSAGRRAANLVAGILKTKGYIVYPYYDLYKKLTIKDMQNIAYRKGAPYFIYGGVSEWRYKVGIDGDPAVSLQVTLYATKSLKAVWSATGSISNWGNDSIGTSAQQLINDMFEARSTF
jgi:hypothetical protein